jgi:HK97 family phage major capsid protein
MAASALEIANTKVKAARGLTSAAQAEGRDLTEDENRQILEAVAELKNARAAEDRAKQRALVAQALDAAAADDTSDSAAGTAAPGSLGAQFVASEQYREWSKAFPNAATSDRVAVNIPPVAIGALPGLKSNAVGGGGSGGLATGTEAGPIGVPAFGPLNVTNLYTRTTTSMDGVEYAQLQSTVLAPAGVAEVTDPATTGLKPDASATWLKVTAPVITIATGIPVTKRAVADVGQVQTMLETFLESGVNAAIENQSMNGTGVGESLTGILATTGVQTEAFATDIFTSIRKGITKVRKVAQAGGLPLGMFPTGVIVSVEDDEAIDLSKDAQNRYYGAGPFSAGPASLWGLPRIATPFLAAGTALVGDFRTCILWDRQQTSISASDSHKDYFMRNLVQLLAEARVAFGVLVPMALCKVATA